MGLEYGRSLPFETKALDDDAWEVSGYLSTFGTEDDGGDIVLPGAFDATLSSGRRVKFLFDHDGSKPLGPPLDLRTDDYGLFATGRMSKTALGADVHTWLQDGAVDSWSIGYITTDQGFRESPNGGLTRLLKAVDLLEGSLVTVPMNPLAVVTRVKAHSGAVIHAVTCATAPCTCEPQPVTAESLWLDYGEQAKQLEEFLERTRQGAALRLKEGRAISAARRTRMASVSGELRKAADDIDALLTETAPPEKSAPGFDARLALQLRAARLRRHGVVLEGATP